MEDFFKGLFIGIQEDVLGVKPKHIDYIQQWLILH